MASWSFTKTYVAGSVLTASQLNQMQSDVLNNTIGFDASNNVGIGTDTPSFKLEVIASATDGLSIGTEESSTTMGANRIGLNIRNATHRGQFRADSNTGTVDIGATTASSLQLITDDASRVTITHTAGNMGLGTSTFGTSAAKSFAIANGTAPTSSIANQIEIFSKDVTGTVASLGLRTEVAVAADADETKFSNKLLVTINGTEYYIMLTTT